MLSWLSKCFSAVCAFRAVEQARPSLLHSGTPREDATGLQDLASPHPGTCLQLIVGLGRNPRTRDSNRHHHYELPGISGVKHCCTSYSSLKVRFRFKRNLDQESASNRKALKPPCQKGLSCTSSVTQPRVPKSSSPPYISSSCHPPQLMNAPPISPAYQASDAYECGPHKPAH